MKKLLVLSFALMVGAGTAVFADEPDTYSGRLLQQYTQKITEVETKLQKEHEAREAEIEKQRQENVDAVSKKLQEIEKQRQQNEADFAKKIEEMNRQAEEARVEMNKKIEEHDKAIEAARQKANEDAKLRKERIEKKKKLWKELISD